MPSKTLGRAIALVFALWFPTVAEEPAAMTADQILDYLNRTVAWRQQLVAIDDDASIRENLVQRDNIRDSAKQTALAAFAFARAEAAMLSRGSASPETAAGATPSLQQSVNKASTRVTNLETRLQTLDARIARSSGAQHDALVDERAAISADLALAKQLESAVKNMASFSAPKANGSKGLLEKIAALEAANPIAPPAEKGKTQPISEFEPQTAGIPSLASKALELRSALKQIDVVNTSTSALLENVNTMRTPLRTSVRAIVAESDRISSAEDNAIQPSEWLDASKQIAELTVRFKQLSTVIVPLGEAAASLEAVRGALQEWRKELQTEYNSTVRYLAIRLGVLIGGLLLVLIASAVWQRAILHYVTEPRRRRQLLLVKRVVVGFALITVLVLGFFSSLGSLATFVGFITAGLALALQNVILSAVAYFFLIGKYGVRVGDRITVQGVTGQVIEVGLIRLFLMELAGTGTDMHPTGRLAVFANSVIFQPSALMKQAPGMDFAWHAATITIEDPGDYQQTKDRFMKAVNAVYEDYRHAIEKQHKTFQTSTDVESSAPGPVCRTQFVDGGFQVSVRYPVSLAEEPGPIDERIVSCLLAELESEPKLKLVAGGSPKVEQVV